MIMEPMTNPKEAITEEKLKCKECGSRVNEHCLASYPIKYEYECSNPKCGAYLRFFQREDPKIKLYGEIQMVKPQQPKGVNEFKKEYFWENEWDKKFPMHKNHSEIKTFIRKVEEQAKAEGRSGLKEKLLGKIENYGSVPSCDEITDLISNI